MVPILASTSRPETEDRCRVQAREAAGFVAAIDWTPVIVALIGMIGSVTSAAIGAYVVWQLRTPSGTSIGKQVESTHLAAIGANHRADALTRRLTSLERTTEADEAA